MLLIISKRIRAGSRSVAGVLKRGQRAMLRSSCSVCVLLCAPP